MDGDSSALTSVRKLRRQTSAGPAHLERRHELEVIQKHRQPGLARDDQKPAQDHEDAVHDSCGHARLDCEGFTAQSTGDSY
eukprot:COSAG01_NODE_1853_length_9060_cov_13.741576_2_plen_81_part_00